jgi:lysylphosphatidylglycerol synthetase-like protein (DUF2156 family)
VLDQIWREKSDEEIAVAATHLSDYTDDAQQVIQGEITRRGLATEFLPRIAAAELRRQLPTAWLRFWIWWRLPLAALTAAMVAIGVTIRIQPIAFPITFLVLLLGFAASAFLVALAVGLQKRQTWAWNANWAVIFGETVVAPATGLGGAKSSGEAVVIYVVLLATALVCWALPNSIYFRKRRILFSAHPEPVEVVRPG